MPIATPQGTLDFKSVDKVTFVGASSNTVIDTTTGSLGVGVGVGGPTSNLHVVGNALITGNVVAGYLYGDGSNISGISGSSSIPAPLFVDSVNDRVGIGAATPATKLHVEHYGSAIGDFEGIRIANHATNLHATSRPAYEIVVSDIAAGTGIGAGKFAIGYRGTTSASRTDRLVIDNSGRVGIGTTNPYVPMHVVGYSGSLSSARMIYAKSNDASSSREFHLQTNMGWSNFGIYASDDIVTGEYLISHLGTLSSSDERIKENVTDIDDASALELFRLLKPKKYQYIDKLKRGDDTVFGFIAQDVEKTMPHGTRKIEETIPNIMEIGTVTETNVITLSNFNTSDLQSNIHTLELHDKGARAILVTIEDIIDEHSIRVDKDLSEFLYEYDENGNDITETVTITESEYNSLEDTSGYIYNESAKTYTKILTNKIYVYGERVDNFLKLNKDTIWTVSTAALQEVDTQQRVDKARITELESQLTAVLARLDALENV